MATDSLRSVMALAVADLPPAQRFLPRHLLLCTFCQVTAWEQANHMFQAEGRRLLRIADALPRKPLGRKVLIQPLWGIDDVSRDWSVEMVLEHLIVAGSAWAETLIQLSNGERPRHPADLAELRPRGEKGPRVVEDFRAFLDDFVGAVSEDVGDPGCTLRYPHPWYGALTAHGWLCLAAVHQRVHRHQAERIVSKLHAPKPR